MDTIVLTGGHAATTALSVLEEIRAQNLPWKVHFIGTRRAVEGKKVLTLESQILTRENVSFHPIIAGRIQRRFTIWTIPSLIKIPLSFFHALYLLLKIRPKVILSFGGFAGFPVVVAGKILGIPSVLHEQTAAAGRANIASALFAKTVALARESSAKHFSKKKIVVIGNPILSGFTKVRPKNKLGEPLTLYITAGSRGSVTINTLVERILRKLLSEAKVIHQTGAMDEAKFKKIKDNLPAALSANYTVFGQINPRELQKIYSETDIVVSRAGANTVSEIIAAKRPALLIPIPWSYQNEQNKNALFARNFGIARVLNQETLTSKALLKEINLLEKDWGRIVSQIKGKESPDLKAAYSLVEILKGETG